MRKSKLFMVTILSSCGLNSHKTRFGDAQTRTNGMAHYLTVTSDKLALPGATHVVTVLDLRARPEDLSMLIDGQHYLPGYHMNKKHWYSILLDDVVPLATIMDDVKVSYMLAK
ncbi:MmcQ/YjbR family DNA-binding protein [Lactiplantibacillus plantarum]|uniref:MmcQ/YjbR family DNA-binding protein n=1 Tax=Lactiplantibacillus plantarum TaxID=1590 RepID=UPI0021C58C98|nr:MmcQ/YjbR family DNA-binding protein [Lactiplantibacillus plantarum]WKF82077.1 MmcQ/YjbR family DNA-binding protein [Lactiplantibacillus plantarum]WKF88178.1 MmcQ/YjbR family DNA-binding protein [Lactiplantibacillus plantarum]